VTKPGTQSPVTHLKEQDTCCGTSGFVDGAILQLSSGTQITKSGYLLLFFNYF
jgi:hypothetical protein